MAEVRTASIEEQVMGAARSYLYGHALAWDVPAGRNGARPRVPVRTRARGAVAALASRVSGLERPGMEVEPGPCG